MKTLQRRPFMILSRHDSVAFISFCLRFFLCFLRLLRFKNFGWGYAGLGSSVVSTASIRLRTERSLYRRVNPVHVVVIIQRVQKIGHFFAGAFG